LLATELLLQVSSRQLSEISQKHRASFNGQQLTFWNQQTDSIWHLARAAIVGHVSHSRGGNCLNGLARQTRATLLSHWKKPRKLQEKFFFILCLQYLRSWCLGSINTRWRRGRGMRQSPPKTKPPSVHAVFAEADQDQSVRIDW